MHSPLATASMGNNSACSQVLPQLKLVSGFDDFQGWPEFPEDHTGPVSECCSMMALERLKAE